MGKSKKEPEKEAKQPEEAGKNWWELSRHIPEGKLDIALWSGGGAAVFFLVLWIIWVAVASSRASSLEGAESKVADLEGKVSSMSETELVEEWKKKAEKEAAARGEAEKTAGDLNGKLRRAEKEKASLERSLEDLRKDQLKQKDGLDKANADLRSAKAKYEKLARDQSNVVKLSRDLEKAKEALANTQKEIAAERDKAKRSGSVQERMNKELQLMGRKYESEITELKRQVEERDQRIKELDIKLAKFPKKPFTEEEAKRRYDELLEEVASVTDHDERIDIFLNAKRALAGTRYERKANAKWETQKRLKKRDIDKAANAVYKEARNKVRSHPQAYDENVAILKKALEDENVINSRYKKAVEKLIDGQKEQKAAAAAAAEKPEG